MTRLREMTARPGPAVWAILVVALLVRVAVVLATPDFQPGADAAEFDRHAVSIANGHGYPVSALGHGPTAFRPPGYPVFLGAVYAVTGDSVDAGRIAQAILGTIVVALIGVLAWQLWGRRAALISMGLGAVAPPLVALGGTLISEPLFLVFLLGALAATIEQRRAESGYRWAIAAGVLAGLATLTRTNGVLLIPILALAVWTVRPRLRWAELGPALAVVAAAVVMMVPWVVRNAIVLDSFIPLTTQGDYALSRNYNQAALADKENPDTPHNPPGFEQLTENRDLDEAEVGQELGDDARQFMRDHPGYVAKTVVRNSFRALHLMDLDYSRQAGDELGTARWLTDAGIYGFWVLGLLALGGAFTRAARRAPWFVWLGPLTAMAPALLIAAGRTRYRAPIDPLIVMLAALALLSLWDRWRARGATPTRSSPAASS